MPTFDHAASQVVPPDALECSVDECRSVPILGETIRYWGMETSIYLCLDHLVEKRRNGMEIDAEGNTIEAPQARSQDDLREVVAQMVVASRIVGCPPSWADYETADRIIAEVRQSSMMPTFPGETDDELPPLRSRLETIDPSQGVESSQAD